MSEQISKAMREAVEAHVEYQKIFGTLGRLTGMAPRAGSLAAVKAERMLEKMIQYGVPRERAQNIAHRAALGDKAAVAEFREATRQMTLGESMRDIGRQIRDNAPENSNIGIMANRWFPKKPKK